MDQQNISNTQQITQQIAELQKELNETNEQLVQRTMHNEFLERSLKVVEEEYQQQVKESQRLEQEHQDQLEALRQTSAADAETKMKLEK